MLEKIESHASFGGEQNVYEHQSQACGCLMRMAVYLPPQAQTTEKLPTLLWLSGLTCNEQNFITKAGAQKVAAELGLIIVCPDTSPRGDTIANHEDYDLGQGAGFYLDATQLPWAEHFNMHSYITGELMELLVEHFPVDINRVGIFGHSMGGHGALMLFLKHPELYKSVSAFAPICLPSQSAWGRKAFENYLGSDQQSWQQYDSGFLLKSAEHARSKKLLIDQGRSDEFLEQLGTESFKELCETLDQPIELRWQTGYDHSYYFIASFMADHLRHHAAALSYS